ncbi:cardiolipin synthase [Kocuria aegyptia]|uniref:Cardiolipin synthase n=1 Tax=Kocuria aegyptia TaxID=330943 RepID=A0ABN2KRN4_9MICC
MIQFLLETPPQWVSVVIIAATVLIGLLAAGIVPHNRTAGAGWGWLLIIFMLPILGIVAYLVFGRADLPRRRKEKQRQAPDLVEKTASGTGLEDSRRMRPWITQAVRLNRSNGAFPLAGGHRIEVLDDYEESLQTMAEAIRGAEHYVHFQFYIAVADDTTEPVIAALEDAQARGITVRVLIDHLGSVSYPGYKQLVHRLNEAGVDWRRMLPVRPWRGEYQRPDLRNHRKILVIDGAVAFTGSMNVIDRSYNKKKNRKKHLQWVGLMLRVQGPAVGHLNAVFATDWSCETDDMILGRTPAPVPVPSPGGVACQVLPSGPGWDQQSNRELFHHVFACAQEKITVCTPYFVPDEALLTALRTAVGRGVEVRLYVGETSSHALTHHAQRSYYEQLIRAGVRIFLYPAPWVLHAKFVLADEQVAVVGSSNMDIRSFALDHEVNLMVIDPGFLTRMHALVDSYHEDSHELDLGDWLARPRHQKYLDNLARLTSALQ